MFYGTALQCGNVLVLFTTTYKVVFLVIISEYMCIVFTICNKIVNKYRMSMENTKISCYYICILHLLIGNASSIWHSHIVYAISSSKFCNPYVFNMKVKYDIKYVNNVKTLNRKKILQIFCTYLPLYMCNAIFQFMELLGLCLLYWVDGQSRNTFHRNSKTGIAY